jgi:NTE family protein
MATIDADIELLRHSPLCEGIEEADLVRMAAELQSVEIETGEYLSRVGDPVDRVYVVATGRLKLTVASTNRPDQELMYFNRGDFVGHNAILDTGRSPVNAIAVTPCRLLLIPGNRFLEWFANIPRLALNMVRALNGRVRQIVGLKKVEGLARTVCAVYAGPQGRHLLALLKKELVARGERLGDLGDTGSDPQAPVVLSLEEWDRKVRAHERVFLDVDLDRIPDKVLDIARRCDQVLWLIDPAREPDMQRALDKVREKAPEVVDRVLIVWLVPEGKMVVPIWQPCWNLRQHHFLVEMPAHPERTTRLQQQGIDRLVRRLRGITLGLALAGGGARGMAHLGVLRAFERERIGFDYAAGTSCGAMVGILYAAGYTPDFCIDAFQHDLRPSRIWSLIPKGHNWHLLWKFRTRSWDRMLRRYLHDWTLEQLPTPFLAMTADLITGREVVRQTGDAVHAILESINLPGMSLPINRDGMSLVDGGILNNLPADVLTARGADLVVGVSVSSKLQTEFAGNRPRMPTERMRKAGTLETLYRVYEAQGHSLDRAHTRSVDVLIEPDTSSFSFTDFTRAGEMAVAGETATEVVLPVLKEKIAELERRAFAQNLEAQEEFVIKPILETSPA